MAKKKMPMKPKMGKPQDMPMMPGMPMPGMNPMPMNGGGAKKKARRAKKS